MRFIFLWLAVVLLPTQTGYSRDGSIDHTISSANFSRFEENGKVGLKDDKGRILIPAIYEAIGWSNGNLLIIDKVVGYQSGGLWGLINTSNKTITPPEFLDLKPGQASLLISQKKSRLTQRPSFGIINTSGKVIIPFIYDGLELSDMRAVVMTRSGTKYQFGLIDLSHKILIPVEFQKIYPLGSLRYAVENFENKTAIYSDEGGQITGFTIDSISVFKKDFAVVYQNQKQGLINRSGQMMLSPTYGEVRLKENGGVEVRDTNEWFFLSGENQVISQHKVDELRPLSANHYVITSGRKLRLASNDLKPLHQDFLWSIADFNNGLALIRKASGTGVITEEGKTLIPPIYQQLAIDRNFFRACLDIAARNRWVILDSTGKPLTEKHYEYIDAFNGKFYPVKNRGFWGALNADGKEIITCVHDSLMQVLGNNIVVQFKGEFGVINLDETWLVPPRPYPLRLLNEEAYLESRDSTTFLKAFKGGLIYFSENPLEYHDGFIREQLPTGAHWLINMDGIVVGRSSQPEGTEQIWPESEGFRPILKDGKYGFIDDQGRLRIANRYEAVQPFKNGMAGIKIRGKWGFIDRHERLIVQPVFDEVQNYDNGHAIVQQAGLFGLIDSSGKMLLPIRYNEITINGEHRFVLRQDKSYGLADATGNVLIHPKYDEISDAGSGYVIVQRGGKFGLLTLRGVSTIPMIYDGLAYDPYHNHFIAVKKSSWRTVKVP